MPDDVQPDEGQGTEATGGLFDSYLQTVPEDGRDTVASYLKDASKNVESRLQEAAEIQKTLGPYKQVEALSGYEPEQLSELLAWHQQVTSSEEAFQQWLTNQAREAGLTPAETQELQAADEGGELTREQIQQFIDQRAAEQVQPIEQRLNEWEEQRQIDTTEVEIRDELTRLESENSLELSPDQKAMVLDLGMNHEGDGSWVQAGFDRFKEITTAGQRAFVAEKVAQPRTPVSGGGVEAFKPTTDWGEATQQARERLRQALT
jgi:hypothetical protein